MNKAFNNFEWQDYPSIDTPLNRANLMKVNNAIDTIDDRVITFDTTKFNTVDAQGLIKSLTFNRENGIFTITYVNGATATIDTMLEKLSVNFDFDEDDQQLVIILDDGTEKRVDLSAFIKPIEFINSSTIAWQLLDDGKVSAIVKEGSIGEKHLRPDYLADIRVESSKAQENAAAATEKASESANSAIASKSYAVGGTNTRDGEDSDNAKHYCEESQKIYENFQSAGSVAGVKGDAEENYRSGLVNITPENVGALPLSGGTLNGNLKTDGHIKNTKGTFDIDFANQDTFDVGTRDSVGNWERYLHFGTSSTRLNEIDQIFFGTDSSWYAEMSGKRFRWDSGGAKAVLEITKVGNSIIKASDHLYVYSMDEIDIESDAAMGITAHDHLDVEAEKNATVFARGRIALKSLGDIRLIPGCSASGQTTPGSTNHVRVGNIKGVQDADGKKPTITNFENINAATFNGKVPIYEDGGNLSGTIVMKTPNMLSKIGNSGVYIGSPADHQFSYMNDYQMGVCYEWEGDEAYGNYGSEISISPGNIQVDGENLNIYVGNSYSLASVSLNSIYQCFRPGIDGKYYLGYPNSRWNALYSATGTIQTSDREMKKEIKELDGEQIIQFIMGLKPVSYILKESDSGRTHYGLISQDVEELMNDLGMTSMDFAGFIKSPKTREIEVREEYEVEEPVEEEVEVEVIDENGTTHSENQMQTVMKKATRTRKRTEKETIPDEYLYSLRYEEFIPPTIKAVQWLYEKYQEQDKTIVEQENKIENLEQRMAEMERKIAEMIG